MKKKKSKNKNEEVKIEEVKEETKIEETKPEEKKIEEIKVEETTKETEKVSLWKKIFDGYMKQALALSGYLMLIELFFHVSEKIRMSGRFVYPILFSLPIGFLLTALFSLLPRLVNRILTTIVISIAAIWTCVQICYASLFGTYMEINKLTMAGDVAESFGNEMKSVIFGNMTKILHVVAFAVIASLILFLKIKINRENWKVSLIGVGAAVILQLICYGALLLGGQGPYSPMNMYKQFPRILDNNMQNFGVMTSFRMDLIDIVIGREAKSADEAFKQDDMSVLLGGSVVATSTPIPTKAVTPTDIPANTVTPVPTVSGDSSNNDATTTPTVTSTPTSIPTPEPTPKTRNTLDIDFEKLISEEKDDKLKALHQYISTQSGTAVNEYTGYFEGYNLIMICAESFTSYMIDEKITPTLYKMANNGFVFNNYYGTFYSVTTNGEYAFCTGLMPNTVGKTNELKTNSTFMLSSDKYLPYCMGNVFKSLGASTFAYHSHTGSYYDRATTHPNMGYEIVRFTDGTYTNGVFSEEGKLTYSTRYPNSDEETILQTMQDYLGDKDENGNVKPFHAYYMTYSGHHPYYDKDEETQYSKNPMVYENREIVDSLDCSSHVKGYIAANLELENMMTQLLKGLEEAGCLENTVIVLTNDHYPYGLTDAEFKELGKLTTGKNPPHTFGYYENAFICYNAGMKNPVVVDTPCCTVDIIPTLLNLFGVDYDSRLLAGTDILDPTSFHIAMLYDQTFITDKVRYDTKWGQIQYIAKKSTVSDEYINACANYVKNKFEISLQVITNDYYRVIYDFLERNK